jgi:hypothetical protein
MGRAAEIYLPYFAQGGGKTILVHIASAETTDTTALGGKDRGARSIHLVLVLLTQRRSEGFCVCTSPDPRWP